MLNLDLNRFPIEIWSKVFQELPSPNDLRAIALSSKILYTLVNRELYQHLYWSDARDFGLCQPTFHRQPKVLTYPTSLMVSVNSENPAYHLEVPPAYVDVRDAKNHLYNVYRNTIPTRYFVRTEFHNFPAGLMVDSDDEWDYNPDYLSPLAGPCRPLEQSPRKKDVLYVASQSTLSSMFSQIANFVNLGVLTFERSTITSDFFRILPLLPALRDLAFVFCETITIGKMTLDDMDGSGLHLTSLTITEDCTKSDNQLSRRCLYKLVTTPTLRSLSISWTRLACDYLALSQNVVLPQALLSLTVVLATARPGDSQGAGVPQTTINPLEQLLRKVPFIHHLRLVTHSTNHLPIWLSDVLPRLRSYSGPVNELLAVSGSELKELEMTEVTSLDRFARDDNARLICDHIRTVGVRFPNLKSLSFFMNEYTEECLYALAQHCPRLEHLKIRYGSGGPEEHTVLAMGAIHLHEFPCLKTFHMYNSRASRSSMPRPASSSSSPMQGDSQPVLQSETCSHGSQLYELHSTIPYELQGTSFTLTSLSDDDMKQLILPWSKPCPELQEVKLIPWSMWRRAFHGDEWCKRDLGYRISRPRRSREALSLALLRGWESADSDDD